MNEQRLAELMVRVADRMASPAEQDELNAYLVEHPELQQELDAHMQIKAITDKWVERLDLDLVEDRVQQSPTARLERNVGTALVVSGVGILGGFGLIEFLSVAEAPLWARLGLSLAVGGVLVLLISVIRWRLATHKSDAYKEVIR